MVWKLVLWIWSLCNWCTAYDVLVNFVFHGATIVLHKIFTLLFVLRLVLHMKGYIQRRKIKDHTFSPERGFQTSTHAWNCFFLFLFFFFIHHTNLENQYYSSRFKINRMYVARAPIPVHIESNWLINWETTMSKTCHSLENIESSWCPIFFVNGVFVLVCASNCTNVDCNFLVTEY